MRDLRKYAKQTNTRLLIGFFLLLLFVGDGLIYFIYGPSAAVSALLCIGAGLIPLLLIWISLVLLEKIAKKADE